MSKFLGYWWNGEIYGACFEADNELLNVISKEDFEVRPVYTQDFEFVDYEIV